MERFGPNARSVQADSITWMLRKLTGLKWHGGIPHRKGRWLSYMQQNWNSALGITLRKDVASQDWIQSRMDEERLPGSHATCEMFKEPEKLRRLWGCMITVLKYFGNCLEKNNLCRLMKQNRTNGRLMESVNLLTGSSVLAIGEEGCHWGKSSEYPVGPACFQRGNLMPSERIFTLLTMGGHKY